MCTVTWLPEDHGYHLLFNRDEQVTRLPARPPAIREVAGVRCVYPVDGQAGGTWLGANAYGVTVGLLNHYAADPWGGDAGRPKISRGKLVVSLLDATDLAAIRSRLSATDLDRFAPFILIAIAPVGELASHTWDGRDLAIDRAVRPRFLTTSSFESERVAAVRKESFDAWVREHPQLSPDLLSALHASRLPEPGPYAVCMERPDAKTLSFSRLELTHTRLRFFYTDGPPDRTPESEPIELTLETPPRDPAPG